MSDTKSAKAVIATGIMDEIILEKFLAEALPKTKQFSQKEMCKKTGYNYYSLRNYIKSDLFTIKRKTIDITDDSQLLTTKSKEYCTHLIKKMVFPSKYEHDRYIYYLGRLYDNSYYTADEKEFIDLLTAELFSIIGLDNVFQQISAKDLFCFNLINYHSFYNSAKKVYNDILQGKLHAGDNIISYFDIDSLGGFKVADMLDASKKYDCFYNKFAILKCDLDKNKNILIKNFLNTVIYGFRDPHSRLILLQKLNSKYPILLDDNIFYEFN